MHIAYFECRHIVGIQNHLRTCTVDSLDPVTEQRKVCLIDTSGWMDTYITLYNTIVKAGANTQRNVRMCIVCGTNNTIQCNSSIINK